MKKLQTLSALSFAALLMAAAPVAAAGMLTAANGKTLYVFDQDAGGTPSCYDKCAVNWPPYLAKKGAKLKTGWTTVARKDGKLQYAYDGKPLYLYKGDKKKGDKAGDGLNGMWHIVME